MGDSPERRPRSRVRGLGFRYWNVEVNDHVHAFGEDVIRDRRQHRAQAAAPGWANANIIVLNQDDGREQVQHHAQPPGRGNAHVEANVVVSGQPARRGQNQQRQETAAPGNAHVRNDADRPRRGAPHPPPPESPRSPAPRRAH